MKFSAPPIQRFAMLLVLVICTGVARADTPAPDLASTLLPWARLLSGAEMAGEVRVSVTVPIQGKEQQIDVRLNRASGDEFDLQVDHEEYAVEIRRREESFAFILPKHKVAYVAKGKLQGQDSLAPATFVKQVCGPGTQASLYAPLLTASQPEAIVKLIMTIAPMKFDAAANHFRSGDQLTLEILPQDAGMQIQSKVGKLLMTCSPVAALRPADSFDGMRVVELPRDELEGQIARGCRRTAEILAPSNALKSPAHQPREVPHGELRWVNGQRVALLSGTPEEIGTAHGQLLKEESIRCLDSVMNVFGTLQTVKTGRWFRHDLQEASARLLPHIPERHRRETRALAVSLELDPQFVEELNVFPELFHCSGFAVFGSATTGGKLYHGRVLDYMTMIGLQDCATTFIVQAEGQIPFANIGYAAFIGSVSGMNLQTISLGEMGGHGEGNWDGVPMATLMRRALEECSTLDEVMALWRDNPRTCEYFYVFAEGKTRRAVGVAALPESVEFIQPGESHPRLGSGIPDSVVLSSGTRLEALRGRVQEKFGNIDAEVGQWLMCRPVAMTSNLHNVLFVPEDGVFYVANADHKHPAADRPYVELNLKDLVQSMPR